MPIRIKVPAGNGDVFGPVSSTDNAIVRFNGGSGKTIQNSGVVINDSNEIDLAAAGTLTLGAATATATAIGKTGSTITLTGTTINIGESGATINIIGSTTYEQVTNLDVSDKLVTINKGGAAGSGTGTAGSHRHSCAARDRPRSPAGSRRTPGSTPCGSSSRCSGTRRVPARS